MSARLMLRLPAVLAPTDDHTLVARFAAERDEASFAALVKRHGAMVLGVCRRAVRDAHHAEDAFQAVFLVLAKNPTAAANAASVGGWLFGVARRVGLSARRRLKRAARTPELPPRSPDPDFDELLAVLDDEVARLPDDCRAAVVACFLREQTQDDAAKQLGWSLSTLRRRLERGKELLRSRLARRGATLSALLLTNAVAKASVPAPLFAATVRAGVAAPLLAASTGTAWVCAVGVALALGAAAFAWQSPDPPPTLAPAPRVVEVRPWVTVRGQIVLPSALAVPPKKEVTSGLKDEEYCRRNGPVIDEAMLVHPKSRGIQNVVVWLRPDSDDEKVMFPKDKVHPDSAALKPRDREVVVECCQFEPRVTVARAGDTMVFKNKSAIVHNVRYQQFVGYADPAREFNVLLPVEGEYRAAKPLPATRFADTFQCGIHRWMQGYVWAFDHPYFAVTDENGTFEIPNAPVGSWRVVVWHEKVGYRGGRAGRLGHKLGIADDGRGVAELKPTPLDSEAWAKQE